MSFCPAALEFLLYSYYIPSRHPNIQAPVVQEAIAKFVAEDILYIEDCEVYHVTARGAALIKTLCNTPLPRCVWVDQNGKEIT